MPGCAELLGDLVEVLGHVPALVVENCLRFFGVDPVGQEERVAEGGARRGRAGPWQPKAMFMNSR